MADCCQVVIAVVAILAVVGLIVGLAVGISGGTDSVAPFICDTSVPLGVEIRNNSDYVGLIFTACPSAATFAAFSFAASRWSEIITRNNIVPTSFLFAANGQDFCSFINNRNVEFPGGTVFDHLTILVEPVEIDGVNGILAQASPCILDTPGNFPIIGAMQFDTADLQALEAAGTLKDVVLHESGHVLGIGTLWDRNDLLVQPIFTELGNNEFTFNPSNIPRFIGSDATDESQALLGNSFPGVPVEDGRTNGQFADFRPDLISGDGRGSIDGHWKIEDFVDELMVYAINPNDPSHPLSRMTIASLADLGYTVDLNQADAFSVSRSKSNLRSKTTDQSDLSQDIPKNFRPRSAQEFAASMTNP